jgi:hypothetical protein
MENQISKKLSGSWNLYTDGHSDEGFVKITSSSALKNYIESSIEISIKDIEVYEIGKYFPHNLSNPYLVDTYKVVLSNDDFFIVKRTYGSPNWAGKVYYKEMLEIVF